MKTYWVKVNYVDKSFDNKQIRTTDNLTALNHILNSISISEKDKVVGVKVFRVTE
jgi:hypothetical protein